MTYFAGDDWIVVLACLLRSESLQVCLVILDDHKHIAVVRSMDKDIPLQFIDPAPNAGLRSLPRDEPESSSAFDSAFAHAIAESRSHVVLLCNWRHDLGASFWTMVAVPPVLSKSAQPLLVAALDFVRDEQSHPCSVSFSSRTKSRPRAELPTQAFSAAESRSSRWYEASRGMFCANALHRLNQLVQS